MAKDSIKLKEISHHIVGIEMQLGILEHDLIVSANELILLQEIERSLVENLAILKKKGIVPLASEYKKIKQDLSTLRANIIEVEFENNFLLSEKERFVRLRESAIKEYDALKNKIESERAILPFSLDRRKKK